MSHRGYNQFVKAPRDERGWIVPRLGTMTREIYDLLVQGKSRSELAQAFPALKARGVDARIWRIKNPERENEKRNEANRLRRDSELAPVPAGVSPEVEINFLRMAVNFAKSGNADKAAEVENDLAFLKYFTRRYHCRAVAPPGNGDR